MLCDGLTIGLKTGGRGVTVQGGKRAVGYNGRGRGCSAQIPIWPGHIGVKAVQDMTATEGRDIRQSAGGGGHGTDTGGALPDLGVV